MNDAVEILEPTTFLAIADRAGLADEGDEASGRLHRVASVLAGLVDA